jgi:hypothetical protein
VVSFTPLLFYPRGRDPGTHCRGGWEGPRTGPDDVEKDSKSDLFGRPARGQSLYRLLDDQSVLNKIKTQTKPDTEHFICFIIQEWQVMADSQLYEKKYEIQPTCDATGSEHVVLPNGGGGEEAEALILSN